MNRHDVISDRRTEKAQILERRLEDAIYEAKQRLQHTAERARRRLDATKHEVHKKLQRLEKQAAHASAPVTQQIEARIVELRADFAVREKQLEEVFEIAKRALESPPAHRA